tara:strand:- start:1554 stop:2204 length:651 start_codon:yes stop_codon:yes gene_type:complete
VGWSHIFDSISLKMKLPIDINQIKGFIHPEEGESLYELALEHCKNEPCLEIGSYCGKSSVYLGTALKINNQILYSIDHHKGSEEQQPGEEYFDPDLLNKSGDGIDTYPFFLDTINKSGLENTIKPIVGTSIETAKSWTKKLSLVFIDGGHSEESAQNDYKHWKNFIIQGGLLLIHDVFPNPKDGGRPPYNIYQKALKSKEFEEICFIQSLAVLKKL